ncbi:uncharacterized protein VTP21DRAFT_4702 [Calcarisporiella thermophila]|uniref:uncharacterized protein n=1 Tax=Calcarisporiella thermophila TaxID=911321 RepID=UPI00374438EF
MDLQKAVGYEFPPQRVLYNRRDCMLYALSIGVKEDELKYLYELDKDFRVFPTYPVVLSLKGASFDATVFGAGPGAVSSIPGLPSIDLKKLVHAEEHIEIFRPLPTQGDMEMRSRVEGIYDRGKGMVIETSKTLCDKEGRTYSRSVSQVFIFGMGGFGGPKGGKSRLVQVPDREPDKIVVDTTSREQAILYRLSGDYNPLHIDPTIAPKIGFERPILHGLCTYGYAAHAILKHFGEGYEFKGFGAKFASPVYPGDTLSTNVWVVEDTPTKRVISFVTKVGNRVVLANGYCHLAKAGSGGSKL